MRMNRLFLSVILFYTTACPAQSIKGGIKMDANFFRVAGDGMTHQFHPGVSGGFFLDYKINSKWSIQPELLFTQRNTKASEFSKYFPSSISVHADNEIFLSYLSVPLVLKYKFKKGLSVHAGAQYNYLLYASENLLKASKEAFKKNDIGLTAGVEYPYSKRLSFYGRLVYGLNDINNFNTTHRWNTEQFQAGAAFSLFGYK